MDEFFFHTNDHTYPGEPIKPISTAIAALAVFGIVFFMVALAGLTFHHPRPESATWVYGALGIAGIGMGMFAILMSTHD